MQHCGHIKYGFFLSFWFFFKPLVVEIDVDSVFSRYIYIYIAGSGDPPPSLRRTITHTPRGI